MLEAQAHKQERTEQQTAQAYKIAMLAVEWNPELLFYGVRMLSRYVNGIVLLLEKV